MTDMVAICHMWPWNVGNVTSGIEEQHFLFYLIIINDFKFK